jgi:hypothetical protein
MDPLQDCYIQMLRISMDRDRLKLATLVAERSKAESFTDRTAMWSVNHSLRQNLLRAECDARKENRGEVDRIAEDTILFQATILIFFSSTEKSKQGKTRFGKIRFGPRTERK